MKKKNRLVYSYTPGIINDPPSKMISKITTSSKRANYIYNLFKGEEALKSMCESDEDLSKIVLKANYEK